KDKKSTTTEYLIGSADKKLYLKLGDKEVVYQLGPGVVTHLKKELRDTRVFSFDPKKVKSVKLEGWRKSQGVVTTRTFENKDGKWSVKEAPGFALDEGKVTGLLDAMASLQAERFASSGKGLKPGENSLPITVTMDDKKTHQLTVGAAE